MDDATAAWFVLIAAGLAGVFGAMAEVERTEVAEGCPQRAVGQALRVGEYDCFLCRTFDWWAPLASPGRTDADGAGTGSTLPRLLAFAADTLEPREDAGQAYPGDTRGRIATCRQIAGWLGAGFDDQV
jgi:hypothetical protein